MTKRTCRNPHKDQGNLTYQEVVELAIKKLGWPRKKVLSWMELENSALKKARPAELVDRQQTDIIVELLDKREADRIREDYKRKEK